MEFAFIDIETIPREDASVPEFDPGRLVDPAKIEAKKVEYREGLTKKMSLDGDLCRIVSAALRVIRDNGQEISNDTWLGETGDAEILKRLAHSLMLTRTTGQMVIVGWNCKGFDLPVIFKRSIMQGIPVFPGMSYLDYTSKYAHKNCIDLMHVWANYEYAKLSDCAGALGIPAKTGMDGSMIYDAYKNGEWKRIKDYNAEDVTAMVEIAKRFGIL